MHTIIAVGLLSFAFLLAPLCAQTNKAIGEGAEYLLRPIAKEAAEKAAAELAAEMVSATGKQVAESTQAQLAKSIGSYGQEVVLLARRVPEATEVLARNAKILLPLEQKMGDDILRIEARAPGFAEMAAKTYGKDDLARLLKLSDPEMRGVLGLSTHTTERQAAQLLLEGTEMGGMDFLKKISGEQILAAGLSIAAIKGVMDLGSKIPPGPETAKLVADHVSQLLFPIASVGAILLAAWGGFAIWRGHRRGTK